MNKPDFCKNCPINHVTEGYVPLDTGLGKELIVGEASGADEAEQSKPFVGGAGGWLNSLFKAAHLSRPKFNIINTIGCRPPHNAYPTNEDFVEKSQQYLVEKYVRERNINLRKNPELRAGLEFEARANCPSREDGRKAVEYCGQQHLWPAINKLEPTRIVALGGEALQAVTDRQGILTWRGSPLPLKGQLDKGPKVIPTLHPSYLMRNSGLFSVVKQDLRKGLGLPPENYKLWATLKDLQEFEPTDVSFDFEWDYNQNITLCGLSNKYYHALVVTWVEPFISEVRRIFESANTLIGHNLINAEMKYIDKWGWNIKARLVDTMLIQHLIQPDMRHDLGFVASVFSSKVFWKGRGEETEDSEGNIRPTGEQWRTWDSPYALPREFGGYGGCTSAAEAYRLYNARDTEGTLQCVDPLLATLKNFGLENTYNNVSIPAAYICRSMAEHGLKVDNKYVGLIRTELATKIDELETQLPEGLAPYELQITQQIAAPPETYKAKTKTCRGKGATRHDATPTSWTFTKPEETITCSVCGCEIKAGKLAKLKRIKVPGVRRIVPWNSADQVKEYARGLGLSDYVSHKTGKAVGDKNARKTWGRQVAPDGRKFIEFTLVDTLKKLNTQKNSFAKPELLEVPRVYFNLLVHGTSEGRLSSSGQRRGIDPNIQNQPKDIRKIFVPDQPGWGFLDSDMVQGENMITAWLAKDWVRWERLKDPTFDEHSYMACKFFNKNVTKDNEFAYLRAPGKVINHGRNYGLGAVKTQEYLSVAGFNYTLGDVKEMIAIWGQENKRTAQWQQETIETAQRQSFLENAFGRRRWFQGRDFATKALAFLPASTLADIVLRCMIGLCPDRFPEQIAALRLRVTGVLPDSWFLNIQVHDSLVAQGPDDTHLETARVVKSVMTQPWEELEGFHLDVEQMYSTQSWGAAKKI